MKFRTRNLSERMATISTNAAATRRVTGTLLLAATLALTGCAGHGGLGSGDRTAQLRPGMTQAEVRAMLGTPAQVETVGAVQVWRYSLHHYFVGWTPHDLVFGGPSTRLLEWHTDAEALQQRRQATLRIIGESVAGSATKAAAPRAGARGASTGCGGHREDRMACSMIEMGASLP